MPPEDTNTEADEEPEAEAEGQSVNDLVMQAERFHDQIDQMKEWSQDFAKQINADVQNPETEDEDAEQLTEAAGRVYSVYRRIQNGDEGVVRGRA